MRQTKPKQLYFKDKLQIKQNRLQERCTHDFMLVPQIDYANDTIIDRVICQRCGLSY